MKKVVSFLWKTPVVAGAVILGAMAAGQVGESGADLVLNTPLMGGLDGIVSDFDHSRGEAIRHHSANAYALQHMSPRGLYLSCEDERIELTEDGEAYCKSALRVGPGERLPGSEHKCGLLGMFSCFYTETTPSAESPAPPCENGAASCEPWEHDWSTSDLKPGSIVTEQGTIQPPR